MLIYVICIVIYFCCMLHMKCQRIDVSIDRGLLQTLGQKSLGRAKTIANRFRILALNF